ncbi:hypothetical protein LCGC14_0400770 [marine sediment metagenome]|uniref:DnaA N-terminal domain-containing protein n=1 Tax=marine sediment metagenome TaxID=412755 RepID=A0A0F9T2D6_9ZZZZ
MKRKTWIKLKRGLLEPEHRIRLGIRIWLFMFMLDSADWPTGIIPEWTDRNAADELAMELVTIRKQRRQLEEDGYISCQKSRHSQSIVIHKWIDPRKYDGKVINKSGQKGSVSPPKETAEQNPTPDMGVVKSDHSGKSAPQSAPESDQKGSPLLKELNHRSHSTKTKKSGFPKNDKTPLAQVKASLLRDLNGASMYAKPSPEFERFYGQLEMVSIEGSVVVLSHPERELLLEDERVLKPLQRAFIGVLGSEADIQIEEMAE